MNWNVLIGSDPLFTAVLVAGVLAISFAVGSVSGPAVADGSFGRIFGYAYGVGTQSYYSDDEVHFPAYPHWHLG